MLFPAGFLVMIVLCAIVIDVSLSQVRARELEAVASSAANDALGALDLTALRSGGELRFDLSRARLIVAESIANGPLPDAKIIDVVVVGNGDSMKLGSIAQAVTVTRSSTCHPQPQARAQAHGTS